MDRRVQRRIVIVVGIAVRAGGADPLPGAAVDVLAARGRGVLEGAHPVAETGHDLLARLAVDVAGLDRRVVRRVMPAARGALLRRRRRGEILQHLGQTVGVDLRAPLAQRRVEPEDLEPGVVAADQLVASVAVDVAQLDRRVLRRIGPAAGVGPARHGEGRSAVAGVARVGARAGLPGRRRRRAQRDQRRRREAEADAEPAGRRRHGERLEAGAVRMDDHLGPGPQIVDRRRYVLGACHRQASAHSVSARVRSTLAMLTIRVPGASQAHVPALHQDPGNRRRIPGVFARRHPASVGRKSCRLTCFEYRARPNRAQEVAGASPARSIKTPANRLEASCGELA